MVQANSNLEDQGQVFTSPSATYVGVYDGHGSPEARWVVTRCDKKGIQRHRG
ncbi:hypothetical protein C1H46_036015 [Malus baccata]|uniref:Uncharacterized protein n=1 Tax=Malus baccata TaxID=106549 RepID=A0A540KW44_MALBA|nr:hypothetical protein C1H46_036015 [Malus baccata]